MNNSDTNQAKQLNETAVMRGFQIGNIVSRSFMNPTPTGLKKEYEHCEIKSLGIERIIVNSKINSNELIKMSYDNIKPVEISEYYLRKFGFEKIDYHRFMIKPSDVFEFYYTYSIHDNAFRFYVGDTIICISTIHYVHQLQNLYFLVQRDWLNLA